jgi:hypothetical protein
VFGPSHGTCGSEYAQLSWQIKEAGLLEQRPGYYIWKITLTAAALAAGWAAFVLGDSWWQLAVATFLAVVFTQIGFLGHDAGHRQVFRTRRPSCVAGILLGNLGIGLSYGWWVDKHNRHHAHPNQEDADPDIALGALAFTAAQARARRGLARLEAYLFFPLLLLEAVNLHVASVQTLTRRTGACTAWSQSRQAEEPVCPLGQDSAPAGRPGRPAGERWPDRARQEAGNHTDYGAYSRRRPHRSAAVCWYQPHLRPSHESPARGHRRSCRRQRHLTPQHHRGVRKEGRSAGTAAAVAGGMLRVTAQHAQSSRLSGFNVSEGGLEHAKWRDYPGSGKSCRSD